jgi:hypothetical protein
MLSINVIWSRWRWALLVCGGVVLVLSAGVLYPGLWKLLGVGAIAPGFADMEALLAAGEAWAAGHDPYLAPNLFDSAQRPHIYGPGWLVTGAAGFTVAQIAEFGVLTILGFLASLAYWYRPTNGRTTLGVLAALLAPSILLGLERANNDLLMVLLLSVTAVLSGRQGRLPVCGVILLLATAAWLKIYPLVAGIALLTLPGNLRVAVMRVFGWALFTAVGFGLYAFDYLRLLRNIPVAQTIFAYDLSYSFSISVAGIPGLRLWTWSGTLLAGLIFVKILRSRRRDYWQALPLTGPWALFTVSAAVIWVGCLAANPSYPYRAVWLLPLLAWGAAPGSGAVVVGRSLCQWILFFLWVWWLQWQWWYTIMSDWHLGGVECFAVVLGLTHASVLLTTGLVAWLLLGWGWRRVYSQFMTPPQSQ